MKTYAEINVDETPIVVLGCGHFFTSETLDGLIGMNTAYIPNQDGRFTELADISGTLATKIPQCPDCQRPVRQYVTQRYNRVINRAVIDELSKRFLVNGKNELRRLEVELEKLEEDLVESQEGFLATIKFLADLKNTQPTMVTNRIQTRFNDCNKLLTEISGFLKKVSDSHQPAHKLHEATIHAMRANQPGALDVTMAGLSLEQHSALPVERDRRVKLAGQMARIKLEFLILEDKFSILRALTSSSTCTKISQWPGGSPHLIVKPILKVCAAFISKCVTERLPKLAVEATIHHARMARLYQSSGLSADSDKERAAEFVEDASINLEKALELCSQPFQNVEQLKKAVQECIKLLQREWYEAVSGEELAAIKEAMVSGPGAIATHSGHWYNCVNGHPFAIGECGMPMEEAHCPECGASIGGLNHRAVAGVTRAQDMEN
ncbi:NFX1-type zinc finger-containing protein 1 [Pochonia chlamydosporia 170]|uniref:NFX1-type zinc finger-containing protein 1 n=1 Tax=Pochonia chlamydosporia 170 TaxID=1380566 RepID=A0A179F3K5_METCM|nr:NFX1-type zinc finger-containing protein 1 [Pochonia chlamydosporia 170]OAQ60006.1 NFX1-type zinc finger-containing protein 1 [Pochonia chlamydosporia 170]